MKKNSEKKGTSAVDIHGRIESLDQNLRSVDHRLRAVEKRLSIKTPVPEPDMIIIEDAEDAQAGAQEELQEELPRLHEKSMELSASIGSLEAQLSDAENRLTKLENLNKIRIGKIKVPVELSGIVAAIVLLGTGYLISQDQWGLIRSPYYPITIGILFGAVVIVKFMMTNRK